MKHYGIKVPEGSEITNITTANGNSFPSNPNNGELFYLTTGVYGLYSYQEDTVSWVRLLNAETDAQSKTTVEFATSTGETNFDLGVTTSEANVIVFRQGIVQADADFTVSGSTLILSDAIVDETILRVEVFGNVVASPVEHIITSQVTKTVGTGKDFTTFHEAMVWVENQVTLGGGAIILSLDDGTHEIGPPSTFGTWFWTYYNVSCELMIVSASNDETVCFITIPSTDDGDQYPTMFHSTPDGAVTILSVTVDPAKNSYPYPSHVTAFAGFSSRLQNGTIVKNAFTGVYVWGIGEVDCLEVTFDTCVEGVHVGNGGRVNALWSSDVPTFNNCTTAVKVVHSSMAWMKYGIFTGNTADYNININEVQADGSFIADGTGLIFDGGTF